MAQATRKKPVETEADAALEARTIAQSHFRTLRLGTPFQPRIDALGLKQEWYSWAGYRAPHSLWDEELEYFAIRSQAALFDISPMTKYRIEGPDAEAYLDRVTLRDVTRLKPGRVHYTAWCDDEGFVLDDGTLFRLSPTRFRLCSQERHLPWLLDSAMGYEVNVEEETEAVAGLALQGPTSFAILRDAGFAGVERLKVFDLAEFAHDGATVTISRTGFTGDLGYELFVPADKALSLWDRLMAAGELRGIRAIGYTALNRARLEAGLIVANADFTTAEHAIRADRLRMPDEVGLGFMVDPEKGHFNGRRAIFEARTKRKLRLVLVGLEIEGNIPAEHAIVYYRKSQEVGLVSAAMWSPMAKRNIALASLQRPYGDTIVDDLWVEIYAMRELQYQKLMKRAKVVQRPFIRLDRRTASPPADF
ncbi:aminomethyl transferase family protein [Mesorhizobium sp. M4A.F.Ca.ET.022.05.2.1]|uniref:aminomethyltransferase family protein n=1 Tax=Mesorhizobium sp. M4A.F.Ca.ET.022.05.2.1 TaxID=2496653 RepID=UPI000FC9B92F|nr:aminomethyltransferase family protein [Mesorhizobium sp. M4A.F.Ca.ET.022.05.2.1]RVC73790.1 aminomethyl transferase family protein [Mesorhizobium sp. M4A.F.Ca.ET.022.05.2.1]